MIELWSSLSYTTKFSTIAFIITAILGFVSIGALGCVLYYTVSFLFKSYPTLNDWRGDWVWPSTIIVGIGWSLGFVFGGIAWYYLSKYIHSIAILRIIYVAILWIWAAFLWQLFIKRNLAFISTNDNNNLLP